MGKIAEAVFDFVRISRFLKHIRNAIQNQNFVDDTNTEHDHERSWFFDRLSMRILH